MADTSKLNEGAETPLAGGEFIIRRFNPASFQDGQMMPKRIKQQSFRLREGETRISCNALSGMSPAELLSRASDPRNSGIAKVKVQDIHALKNLSAMSKDDKIRACYQHACLCYVSSEEMTNTSLRKRFGIADQNYATASRIIADTAAAKLIRQADETNTSKKNSKYVPFWG